MSFRLPEILSLGNRRRVWTDTPTVHDILSCTVVAQTECTITHWSPRTCTAQATKLIVFVSPNTSSSSCSVVHFAEPDPTDGHSFLTSSWISLPVIWTHPRRSTGTAAWRPSYRLGAQPGCWRPGLQALHGRRSVHWTWGFTCQTLVLPPVYHSISQWLSGKHCDTPPGSDLDDEQLRALLASPLYSQERKASAERSQVYHSERENLISRSSQDPTSTGKPVAVFSSQKRFPWRVLLWHQQVLGAMNLSSDSRTRQMLRILFLMEPDIICLLKRDLNFWSRNTKWVNCMKWFWRNSRDRIEVRW